MNRFNYVCTYIKKIESHGKKLLAANEKKKEKKKKQERERKRKKKLKKEREIHNIEPD